MLLKSLISALTLEQNNPLLPSTNFLLSPLFKNTDICPPDLLLPSPSGQLISSGGAAVTGISLHHPQWLQSESPAVLIGLAGARQLPGDADWGEARLLF